MTDTSAPAPVESSQRTAFAVIAGMAGVLGLILTIDGIWRTISIAVGTEGIELPARGDLPGVDARISTATVLSSDVGGSSLGFLIAGSTATLLVTAATWVTVVLFLVLAARGTPFHHLLARVALVAGTVMTFGGLAGSALSGVGRVQAADHLGAAPDGPFEAAFTIAPGEWSFGVVVLVAAYVIRIGQRLQRDTEGLV